MRKFFTKTTIGAFFLGLVVMFGIGYFWPEGVSCADGNVGIVKIVGEIDSVEDAIYYSVAASNIIRQIEELEADTDIKGIVLDIDSGGGAMESSESIMLALKGAVKPVVAVIHNSGVSGAYLAATGADRIYASRMSDV